MRILPISLLGVLAFAQDPLTLDPSHYTVVLENDRVRALRVRYGPMEGSPMHEHPPGIGVAMTNTKGKFQLPDGSVREASGTPAGSVFWRAATRHSNRNMLSTSVEMIEMDLKRVPAGPPATVTKSDPPDPTENVELENQWVRILRWRIPPGANTSSHAHPERVVVPLSDQQLRVRDSAGAFQIRRLRRGEVLWEDASTLGGENVGTAMAEAILIELKPAAASARF